MSTLVQNKALEHFFDLSIDMLCTIDHDGHLGCLNLTWEKELGFTIPELSGKPFIDFIHPADQLPTLRALKNNMPGTEKVIFKSRCLCKDQSYKWFVWQGTVIEAEKKWYFVVREIVEYQVPEPILTGASTDNESRETPREVEELVLQTHAMQAILESIDDGIIATDENGNFIFYNFAARNLIGMGPEAVPVEKWAEYYGFFQTDCVTLFKSRDLPLVRAMRGENVDRVEMYVKNDRLEQGIYLSLSGRPLKYPSGEVKGGIIVFRNISEQKQIEMAFIESDERLNLALKSSQIGIWSWDLINDYLYWDDYIHPLFGLEPHRFSGQFEDFLKMLHPEDRERVRREVNDSIKNAAEYRTEYRVIWPDKSIRILTSRGKVYRNEEGRGLEMIGVCWDVTDRRRAEEALREKERRYRTIFESAPVSIWELNIGKLREGLQQLRAQNVDDVRSYLNRHPDWLKKMMQAVNIVDFNNETLSLFGARDKDELKTNLDKLLLSKTFPVVTEAFVAMAENQNYFTSEVVMRTLAGKKRHILISIAFQDSQSRDDNVMLSCMDITQQKMAEERIRKIHKETEQLLASISSVLIGVNEYDIVTRWNSAAEALFGMPAQKIIGKSFLQCGIRWDWEEILLLILDSQQEENATRWLDIGYTQRNGKKGFLNMVVTPIYSEQGERAGYLILATDVTERKNLESQLVSAQKLEAIGQLAAGIAHEINTPIQYVGDNTSFLQESFKDLSGLMQKYTEMLTVCKEQPLTPEMIYELEDIAQEIDLEYLQVEIPTAVQQSLEGVSHVASIVQAMKAFSHPGTADKTLLDINKALENTSTVSRNEWKYIADIVSEFEEDLPLVPCLPGELSQVFLNIIVNAAHAIADATKDTPGEKGTITLKTAHDAEWVIVRISDSGTGIPEEIRSRIFDPFFTTKEIGKGTGQGLAISYNVVVDKHGGKIDIESELGRGTTFIIHLPRRPGESNKERDNG